MTSTYRTVAEKIRTTFYKGLPSDDATFSLRFIAQLISEEMASLARDNATSNSNLGETTYANDTFIATFKNQAVLTDTAGGFKYVPLPSIPTALPCNQEIQKIVPLINGKAATKRQILLITNRSKLSQDMLPTIRGFVLAYVENGNLIFDNTTAYNFTAVNLNLIGAMPDGSLLDTVLLLPKNYEPILSEKIIKRLLETSNRHRDILNDAQPANN